MAIDLALPESITVYLGDQEGPLPPLTMFRYLVDQMLAATTPSADTLAWAEIMKSGAYWQQMAIVPDLPVTPEAGTYMNWAQGVQALLKYLYVDFNALSTPQHQADFGLFLAMKFNVQDLEARGGQYGMAYWRNAFNACLDPTSVAATLSDGTQVPDLQDATTYYIEALFNDPRANYLYTEIEVNGVAQQRVYDAMAGTFRRTLLGIAAADTIQSFAVSVSGIRTGNTLITVA